MTADVKDPREDRLERLEGGDPIPPLRADDHSNADPAVESPVEARQGFLDSPVLMVLIGGLVLAMIAWVVIALTY